MSTLGFIGALVLWWATSTVGCGGLACVPYVLFFYSFYAVPVVAYCAIAEAASRQLAARWSPLLFLVLAGIGFAALIAQIRLNRAELMFTSWESASLYVHMIFIPTAVVVALYLAKSLRHLQYSLVVPK